jgi:cytochrome bd-type quinol oxidase subunit 1
LKLEENITIPLPHIVGVILFSGMFILMSISAYSVRSGNFVRLMDYNVCGAVRL